MVRPSPFANVTDGPAPDAVVVELGRPTRAAVGCFGLTTLFLALVTLAALSYAAFQRPVLHNAPPALRVVAGVLGVIFLAIVIALITVLVKAVRARQGIAFDTTGVWWRAGETLVTLPWLELGAARLVTPVRIRGMRTSTPTTPAVELCPLTEQTIRRYPQLTNHVTSGEPVQPTLPTLRFAFRLPGAEDGQRVAAALERLAPAQWTAGQEQPTDTD